MSRNFDLDASVEITSKKHDINEELRFSAGVTLVQEDMTTASMSLSSRNPLHVFGLPMTPSLPIGVRYDEKQQCFFKRVRRTDTPATGEVPRLSHEDADGSQLEEPCTKEENEEYELVMISISKAERMMARYADSVIIDKHDTEINVAEGFDGEITGGFGLQEDARYMYVLRWFYDECLSSTSLCGIHD